MSPLSVQFTESTYNEHRRERTTARQGSTHAPGTVPSDTPHSVCLTGLITWSHRDSLQLMDPYFHRTMVPGRQVSLVVEEAVCICDGNRRKRATARSRPSPAVGNRAASTNRQEYVAATPPGSAHVHGAVTSDPPLNVYLTGLITRSHRDSSQLMGPCSHLTTVPGGQATMGAEEFVCIHDSPRKHSLQPVESRFPPHDGPRKTGYHGGETEGAIREKSVCAVPGGERRQASALSPEVHYHLGPSQGSSRRGEMTSIPRPKHVLADGSSQAYCATQWPKGLANSAAGRRGTEGVQVRFRPCTHCHFPQHE